MLTVFDDDSTPVGVILAVGVGVKVVVCVIVAVRDFDTLDSADASGGGGGIGDDDGVIDDVSVLEQVPEPVIVSVGDNESDDVGEGVGDVDQVTLAEPPSEKVNVSEAVTVIEKLNVEWDALRQTLALPARTIRVMFILAQTPSQTLVAGTDTGADAMLKHAGLQNAFSGVRGYRPVSAEAIIAAQPDLVVLTQSDALTAGNGSNSRSLIHQFKGLSATPAARPGRWLVFDTMFLLSFGPRLPDAILTLRRASIEAMRT